MSFTSTAEMTPVKFGLFTAQISVSTADLTKRTLYLTELDVLNDQVVR